MWWWSSVVALLLVAACGDGSATTRHRLAPDLQPVARTLLAEPVSLAVRVAGDAVLADSERGLLLLRSAEDEGAVIGASGELGEVRSVIEVDGATLIAGSGGLFVVRGGSLFASPVAAALPAEEELRAVAATPREDADVRDVWVLTDASFYLVRDATLRRIELQGVAIDETANLGVAPGVRGRAVWLATGGRLYEVQMEGDELVAARVKQAFTAQSMATDGDGRLWMAGGGELRSLDGDRRLVRHRLPFVADAVHASLDGPDVWVEGEGGLHHLTLPRDGPAEVRLVTGVPPGARIAPGGRRLLAASDGGLIELAPRHRVTLGGLADGARLSGDADVEVEVMAEGQDRLVTVEALLDGEPITATGTALVLSVVALEAGAHALEVTARFDDGTLPVLARVSFTVGIAATWTEHVQPLFDERCSDCHGPAGPAPTRLDSREAWVAHIDLILRNVREGRMPLNREPLDPATIALIEAWSASGFPE